MIPKHENYQQSLFVPKYNTKFNMTTMIHQIYTHHQPMYERTDEPTEIPTTQPTEKRLSTLIFVTNAIYPIYCYVVSINGEKYQKMNTYTFDETKISSIITSFITSHINIIHVVIISITSN